MRIAHDTTTKVLTVTLPMEELLAVYNSALPDEKGERGRAIEAVIEEEQQKIIEGGDEVTEINLELEDEEEPKTPYIQEEESVTEQPTTEDNNE
jgi:hypothetical protein